MLIRHISLAIIFNFFLLCSSTSYAQITDDTPHTAQRVISLSPHATELAFSAGLGDKLIGVSQASDYPPQAKAIERVAGYQGIKLERILALQPDLVIAWKSNAHSRELNKLKQFGIPVYYSSIESLEDIASNLRQLSQWAEDPSIGQLHAKQFEDTLHALKAKYRHQTKVRYFYQLSSQPLMSFTSPHWPSDIFTLCGGENIMPSNGIPYPQVGVEQVVALSPEVIFTPREQRDDNWQAWQHIPAVQHGFIWSLNPDWISRPTMRSLKAITQVCQYLDKARSTTSKAQ